MEYKYDVGDAVVVKQDLKTGCNYFMESGPSRCTYNNVVDEMKEFGGTSQDILMANISSKRTMKDGP